MRIVKLFVLLIVFFTLIIITQDNDHSYASNQAQPDNQETWTTYIDSEFNFSIQYPSSWEIKKSYAAVYSPKIRKVRVYFISPELATIAIDVWTNISSKNSYDWFSNDIAPDLTDDSIVGKLPSQPNAIVCGTDAIYFEQPVGDQVPYAYRFFLLHGNNGYMIHYNAFDGGKKLETFKSMVKSFSLGAENGEDVLPEMHTPMELNIRTSSISCPSGNCSEIYNQGCCAHPAGNNPFPCSREIATGHDKGNCTWWAAHKRPQLGLDIANSPYRGCYSGGNHADAADWLCIAQHEGYATGHEQRVGSTYWVKPGTHGTGSAGHVAHVIQTGSTTVKVSEMNWCITCDRDHLYSYLSTDMFIYEKGGGCCGCLPSSCCASNLAANNVEPAFQPDDTSASRNHHGFTRTETEIPSKVASVDSSPNNNASPVFFKQIEKHIVWSNQPQAPVFTWPAADDDDLSGYKIYWGKDPKGTGYNLVQQTSYRPPALDVNNLPDTRFLRIVAEDSVGNQSNWQTVAIWHYDPIAPTGSLTVANGSPRVRSLNVSLDLDATDEGGFVSQMRFSSDGVNWTEWEPYARRKSWQLANTNEPQTIFAQVQDEAGNVSTTMAASIVAALNVGSPSSLSYSIARSTFSMGGADKSSISYQVRGTIGQAYQTGHMQSSSYQVNSGYWAGAACATAEFFTAPDISIEGISVTLSWAAVSGATSYNIYRGTDPFFTPTTSYDSTNDITWTDPNAIGDSSTNYHYIVKPVNACGESSTIYRLGEFDFELIPGQH